jgi:hypothetical protein
MSDTKQSLLSRYAPLLNPDALVDVAGTLGKGLGVQALSGIKGLSELPHGMDAAADAVAKYQHDNAPGLSPEGQSALRAAAPAYYALQHGAGKALDAASAVVPAASLMRDYGHATDTAADLAGRIDPRLGGAVGATMAAAPYAGVPEGAEAEAAAPAARMLSEETPRVHLNSTPGALEREGEAARRDNTPAFTVSTAKATDVGHPQAGLIGYHPDATVIDAHDPASGEHIGRIVAEPSADGTMLQGRTADVYDENNRGKGVGTSMLRKGVDTAHGGGMDWGSDVKLSPGQVATYMKLQESGYPIEFNPTSTVHGDQYLTSGDGRPVIRIPQPTHPDGADPGEPSYPGAASGWIRNQAGESGMNVEPLAGMPTQFNIPGVGPGVAGPNPMIRGVASQYMADHGLTRPPVTDFAKVDPAQGAAVAQAYDAAQHAPNDPKVAASYQALINETKAQYQYIKQTGFQPEFIPQGSADPYAASPRLAVEDINRNNHMWVFPTSSGFGTDAAAAADHPMLADSGETIGGQPATNNDLFRVVHDYFGHAKEGVGFRADGEENAWRQHAQMYSDAARPAMTAETRGQNSWVNFGPQAQANAGASGADTVYAPQKATILPDQFNHPEDPYERAASLVSQNGGVTMHPGTGAMNPSGYAVSTYPGRESIIQHQPEAGDLRAYVSAQGDLFNQDPGAHLGVWEHPPGTGQHYMDVSHVEPDLDTATALARQHNQLGIFDMDAGQTIMTPPDPTAMAAGGHVNRFGEGGEAGVVLGGLGDLMAKYAPKATASPSDYATNLTNFMQGAHPTMLNDAGYPKTFYHGTTVLTAKNGNQLGDIQQFDPSTTQRIKSMNTVTKPDGSSFVRSTGGKPKFDSFGSWFSSEPGSGGAGMFSGGAGAVYPVHINLNNPYQPKSWDEFYNAYSKVSPSLPKNPELWKQHLLDNGYDGIVFPQDNYDGGDHSMVVALHPEQVKSAVGNVGTFDPTDPDITKAAGGLVRRFDEGGEVGTVLGGLGEMMARYAPEGAAAPTAIAQEAQPLADHVATYGGVTYDPLSGNTHVSGTVTDAYPDRAQYLNHAPDAGEIHDFMMSNQDVLGNEEAPGNVLHVTSDEDGNHFMRIGQHEPEMPKAEDEPDQDLVSKYLENAKVGPRAPVVGGMQDEYEQSFNAHTPATWTAGEQTVNNPKRNAFPGVYSDPRQTVADATAKVAPEDPLLQRLFGVSRSDLSDLASARQGNELGNLPGLPPNPRGSEAAMNVAVPKNAQRLQDVLAESRNSPSLFTGMNGWYSMDPLYERFRQIYGDDEAPARYSHFNTLMSMASPGSPVDQEIARGSAAHWLANEGRFADFDKYGGGKEGPAYGDRPADMEGIPGHVYHATAQSRPMSDYVRTGQVQLGSAKVPVYMGASGVPETGFQTDLPTGDAHFARAVGLADTRGDRTLKGQPAVPGSSASTAEMGVVGPWFRNSVASPLGMEASPAQAVLWGAMSPHTGVKSAIGAPKLELLSQQIGKVAQRLGVSPETARDLVITGKAGAFRRGGRVH